ncbi:MAG: dTDP-4-dehydrorhamnose 3,5-epimerase [Bacteroidales bacterium]|jgi:dTDP-4-dehydrorhamnose 3,5-epimerase|nr:dTDP-4-dehydrorhamnose 3,5-epimerase [Bacteroidales bacterium]
MNYIQTDIEGPLIVEPRIFGDHRGYFFESFSLRDFEAHVGPVAFVQDNESYSAKRGVLRGLHFQKGDMAQAKLLRVVRGCVLDVAVDIREGSPTFGHHVKTVLSGDNKRQFYIPRGFAHGFLVLEDDTVFQYKCDNYYAPESEGSYRWNDPFFAIDWGISPDEVILSEKDARAPFYRK